MVNIPSRAEEVVECNAVRPFPIAKPLTQRAHRRSAVALLPVEIGLLNVRAVTQWRYSRHETVEVGVRNIEYKCRTSNLTSLQRPFQR